MKEFNISEAKKDFQEKKMRIENFGDASDKYVQSQDPANPSYKACDNVIRWNCKQQKTRIIEKKYNSNLDSKIQKNIIL